MAATRQQIPYTGLFKGLTYIFKIDEGVADTKQLGSTIEGQHEQRKTYLQLLAKSGQCLESAKCDSQGAGESVPMRRYMKSYFPRLVSSTISLSIA